MSPIKALLFDWDGTLINSLDVKIANAADLFHEALGIDPVNVSSSYRWHSGIPRHQLFNAICTDNGLAPLSEEMYQMMSRKFSELNLKALTLNPDAHLVAPETHKTLRVLNEQCFALYVSSSAITEEINKIAEALAFTRYFREIIGSKIGFSKGKDHVEYVAHKECITFSQIAFIGDDPNDVELGKSAGVFTIAKVGTHSKSVLLQAEPDHVINNLSELPYFLNALNSIPDV